MSKTPGWVQVAVRGMNESSIFPITLLSVLVHFAWRYYKNLLSSADDYEYDSEGGSTKISHGDL